MDVISFAIAPDIDIWVIIDLSRGWVTTPNTVDDHHCARNGHTLRLQGWLSDACPIGNLGIGSDQIDGT